MNLFVSALIAIIVVCSCAWGETLRCGDRLVSTGAASPEVVLACGEPYWKDRREELQVENLPAGKKFIRRDIDEWTYNFGPDSFVYFLRFEGGRLVSIRSGDYGYSASGTGNRCGDGLYISMGDFAGEVALKCGPPLARENSWEEIQGNDQRKKSTSRESWTYSFTSGKVVVITLEDGRVSAVESR